MRRLVVVLALSLVGCQSTYAPAGVSGGYEEEWLGGNGYEIKMHELDFDGEARIDALIRRRAAEIALENGKRYFEVKAEQKKHRGGFGPSWHKVQVELMDTAGPRTIDAVEAVRLSEDYAGGRLSDRAREQLQVFEEASAP